MSIFQKKRGRPAKNSGLKKALKVTKYSIFSILGFVLSIIIFIVWSFSNFLFLASSSYDLLGMGKNNNKTYLITLHNDGELRPTLGFLTGFIFLEIQNGKMNMEFHDSYDITPPEISEKILAPDIIEERFSQDSRYQGWVMRDANFSPLHAKNSQKILDFLQYDSRYKNKKIDAVISIDLYALGKIIDSVGGIEFSGKTITSQNLFSILETNAKTFDHHSEKAWLSRKNEIKPLAQKIIKTIVFSPFHWKEFSNTVEKLGNEKHFLVYFKDEKIQKLFSEETKRDWSGDFNPPKNSFLMGHNFANLGGKKGDRYITKDFSSVFSVSSRGEISERLSLRLQHNGTRSLNSDRYFAFVRIFREKGAVLEKFSGDFINSPLRVENPEKKSLSPEKSNQYEEFQFFIEIDESSEKTFSFEFSYPEKINIKNANPQKIFIFSQAGKNAELEKQSLVFQAEGDASFKISGCDTQRNVENISRCEISSSGDKTLTLEMIPDTKKPILEESIIQQNGKVLRLQFAEEIQEIYPSSVVLQEKITGKKVEISDLTMEKKAIILTFKNPLQKNHPFNKNEKNFYKIYIDDISDISGNSISPFVMTISAR